jgi:hypothetical protein
MNKLITLNKFVEDIENYVNESKNISRALQLIFDYQKFLSQPIKEEMFLGDDTLFPGFVKATQKEATIRRFEKTFYNFGKDGFYVSVLHKEYGEDKKPCFVTSFHLKTVGDLVGKVDECNGKDPYFGWID